MNYTYKSLHQLKDGYYLVYAPRVGAKHLFWGYMKDDVFTYIKACKLHTRSNKFSFIDDIYGKTAKRSTLVQSQDSIYLLNSEEIALLYCELI